MTDHTTLGLSAERMRRRREITRKLIELRRELARIEQEEYGGKYPEDPFEQLDIVFRSGVFERMNTLWAADMQYVERVIRFDRGVVVKWLTDDMSQMYSKITSLGYKAGDWYKVLQRWKERGESNG